MSRKLSFRRSRNACRRAECACRASMNCRFRRKMRFAPGGASFPRSIRRSGGRRCCSAWPRWGWAAAKRSLSPVRGRRLGCPFRQPSGCQDALRRGKKCDQNRARNQYQNTPNARHLRDLTSTEGKRLCITGAKKTSSTFRHSCVDRRINARIRVRYLLPSTAAGRPPATG